MPVTPPPLRKRRLDGSLYTRPLNIEQKLSTTLDWSFKDFVQRATVFDIQHADYIASEIVLHHLRMTRDDDDDIRFNALYPILEARFLRGFPKSHTNSDGQQIEDNQLEIMRRDQLDGFVELLLEDRQGYEERLDFFEVRFEIAAKKRRLDAFRAYYRAIERVNTTDVYDESTHSRDVEAALVEFQAQVQSPDASPAFRFELRREIDLLPDDERQVIDMWMTGIPDESNDPSIETISSVMNCTAKTVRNRRNRAFERLRAALGGGDNS